MLVIGIDTGVSGGMALYSEGLILECYDVPYIWEKLKTKSKAKKLPDGKVIPGKFKRRKKIDYMRLTVILTHWQSMGAADIFIELIHSMPRDSPVAAFSFGTAFGAFNMAGATLGLKSHFITPQQWKKALGLINEDKEASLELAREMFGTEFFKLKKDHNKAEAALISAYGFSVLSAKQA